MYFVIPKIHLSPPLTCGHRVDGWEVLCAFNAGVIESGGEILMLMRVAERPVCSDPNKVLVPMLKCGQLTAIELSRHRTTASIFRPASHSRARQGSSHLDIPSRLARSRDGVHFEVDAKPALFPDTPYEAYGLEDPRITKLGDTYYVVYKGVSAEGITQCLATTKDFVNWTRHGIILS